MHQVTLFPTTIICLKQVNKLKSLGVFLDVSIHKRCFRLVLNDYENNYATLLKRNNTTTMESKRLSTLGIGIFKTINNINSSFMKDIFTPKSVPKVRP